MTTSNQVYDIAIIGGGIAGAGIARDASLRGLKVVLFEKAAFGSGTSSKSSKLIHGGLRYLELSWFALKQLNFFEAWKNFYFVLSALQESSVLEKIAPELVKPIELVVPIYKRKGVNALLVYFGTFFYGLLSVFAGNKRLPRILKSKHEVLRLIPNLNPDDLLGGVIIWDHWTDDKKLVEEIIKSAVRSGASAFERSFLQSYQYDEQRKIYTLAVHRENGIAVYEARKIVNATGPWIDKVRKSAKENDENFIVPVAGIHITLKKFTDYSVVLQADDKRIFFVINIGSFARVGTTERIHKDPDNLEALEEEVDYLLSALERYFPNIQLTMHDLISKDAGIRPLAKPKKSKSPHAISREHEIRVGPTGVLHVLGVKLTDHRRAAKNVVDKMMPDLKHLRPNIQTRSSTHLASL